MITSRSTTDSQRQHSTSLAGSVLILNRSYMPVHVVSVRRAMVMLYRDLGEVIYVDGGHYGNYNFASWLEMSQFLFADEDALPKEVEFIRTVNYRIQVPRVLRLHRFDKVPRLSLRFNRRNLFARDNYECQFCEQRFPASQLSFDHVVPKSRGGKTSWENVVCSCLKCNNRKGNRTPAEAGMKLAKTPVRPTWSPMLSIHANAPRYEAWKPFLNTSRQQKTPG